MTGSKPGLLLFAALLEAGEFHIDVLTRHLVEVPAHELEEDALLVDAERGFCSIALTLDPVPGDRFRAGAGRLPFERPARLQRSSLALRQSSEGSG